MPDDLDCLEPRRARAVDVEHRIVADVNRRRRIAAYSGQRGVKDFGTRFPHAHFVGKHDVIEAIEDVLGKSVATDRTRP